MKLGSLFDGIGGWLLSADGKGVHQDNATIVLPTAEPVMSRMNSSG